MKCKNCMAEIGEGTLFCPECGRRVDDDSDKTVVLQEDLDLVHADAGQENTQFSFCPNCGNKIDSDSVFCGSCGCRIDGEAGSEGAIKEELQPRQAEDSGIQAENQEPELCFCPNCGNKIESSSVFCEFCGYKLDGTGDQEAPSMKKKKKLPIAIGVAAVAVVAACVLMVPKLTGHMGGASDTPSELFYIKDRGLYGVTLSKQKKSPVEYTDEMLDYNMSDAINMLSMQVGENNDAQPRFVSKDGSCHFIIENLSYENGTYSLYYKKGKKEPVKIDSDIQDLYKVTDDNKVVYRKNDNLYVHDLKDKTKIASDVESFRLDKAGKNVLWQIDSGYGDGTRDIYYQDLALRKDKIKIDSGAVIKSVSSDLNTILLLKEGSVYLVKNQADKEKLVGNVDDLYSVDLSAGTFFYTEEVEGTVKAMEYVADDLAAQDAQMKEPIRSDYERQEPTGGFNSYNRTVLDNSFYEDKEKYEQKLKRDQLRQELMELEINTPYVELYYYANGEKTLVTSEFRSVYADNNISEKEKEKNKNLTSYIIYTKANVSEMKKIKLSELSYASDVSNMIRESKNGVETLCLYTGNKETELDLDDRSINRTRMDTKNNKIYCLAGEPNRETGKRDVYDLIAISLNSSDSGTIEEKDSDVNHLEKVVDGDIYYMKDVNDYQVGDLYCNGRMIQGDVSSHSVKGITDSSAIVCLTDPSRDKVSGTAVKIKGDKVDKLADDVNIFHAFSEKSIVMITDFSYDRYKGDLKYYNGKDTETIDTDVRGFFH